MREIPPLGTKGVVACALVLGLAAGLRLGYLAVCCEGGASTPRFAVQGGAPPLEYGADVELRGHKSPGTFDALVHNVREHRWFGSLAPLADGEEKTAHVAPGYYWLAAAAP